MKRIYATFLVLLAVFALTGCSSRTALTAEDFKSSMEAHDFTIVDASGQFAATEGVETVLLAMNENYQIEFFVVSSNDLAISSYNQNKETFESMKGGSSAHTSASVANYSFYTLSTGGKYYVISRVDNTFIYAAVDKDYKDEVSTIIKGLGY